jgi:hypothetical protein
MRSALLLLASFSLTACRREFSEEIARFEAADRVAPPRPGGVVFVGSSSIHAWPNLQADFSGSTWSNAALAARN